MNSFFLRIIAPPVFLMVARIIERTMIRGDFFVLLFECGLFAVFFSSYYKTGRKMRLLTVSQMLSGTSMGIGVAIFFYALNCMLGSAQEQNVSLINAVVICIISPIIEEIVYRGFVMDAADNCFTPTISCLLSAGLFAAAHSGIFQNITSFIMGLLFGMLRHQDKTLLTPILTHSTANFTLLILEKIFITKIS